MNQRMYSFAGLQNESKPLMRSEQFADINASCSPQEAERRLWQPSVPMTLRQRCRAVEDDSIDSHASVPADQVEQLAALFPNTWRQKFIKLVADGQGDNAEQKPLRVGVVLSGGQAAGGHNVIAGLYDYIKSVHPQSQLIGFLNGPIGVYTGKYVEVDDTMMNQYRNMGGFDMICSGRHKIETEEQKSGAMEVCANLDLNGLLFIGGDDTCTSAAILAEYFREKKSTTAVCGAPKTIDGDLKNEYIEVSFGFDTAVKTYSEEIGNLCVDVATSHDRYHFVRLMGRSASNIALECALQTRANLTFIGEEVERDNRSLKSLCDEVCDMIVARAEMDKSYGVILLPEGLIEFVPEVGALIRNINDILAEGPFDEAKLSVENRATFHELPEVIRVDLLAERDSHGNVQVAKIATEKLLIGMVEEELARREFKGEFIPTDHYLGYEGRCAMPSNFDANYCYALGRTAGCLIESKLSGYMAVVRDVAGPVEKYQPGGCPITGMLNLERRVGKNKPVIKKYLVDMEGGLFKSFATVRELWKYRDLYRNPGPIQFEGASADSVTFMVSPPSSAYLLPELDVGEPSAYCFTPKCRDMLSALQIERLHYRPAISPLLKNVRTRAISAKKCEFQDQQGERFVRRAFPLQTDRHALRAYAIEASDSNAAFNATNATRSAESGPRVGVVLAGQPVPGASNVVVGLLDRLSLSSGKLIGFKGITGLLDNNHVVLTKDHLKLYVNQAGFEVLGRTLKSKHQLRNDEGVAKVAQTCKALDLTGLVLIGGQTSLTDAAVITEYFLAHNIDTRVIGVPANQENNVQHSLIEAAVGFDSCSKSYSALLGNLLTDAASATKYWYFVRLMGNVPSSLVLESALQTHPNFTVVSERYVQENMSLKDIVRDIADVVVSRSNMGKNFGTVIVPEGVASALPQMKALLSEIDKLLNEYKDDPAALKELRASFTTLSSPVCSPSNSRLTSNTGTGGTGTGASTACVKEGVSGGDTNNSVPTSNSTCAGDLDFMKKLTPWSAALLETLPGFFREQLVKPTPTGRMELSALSVEQLLAMWVNLELRERKAKGIYSGSFAPVCHYFGFQGRSSMPSNFDCALGLAHGYLAAILIESNLTGFLTSVRGLCGRPDEWRFTAVPLTVLLRVMPQAETEAFGRHVPMIPCADVDLSSKAYAALSRGAESWETADNFCNPGPIQFAGPTADYYNRTLYEQQFEYIRMLAQLDRLLASVGGVCGFGVSHHSLKTAVVSLNALATILNDRHN